MVEDFTPSKDNDVFKGLYHGERVRFRRNFIGHTLTDDEIERLLNDEELEIDDLYSKKSGKNFTAKVKMGDHEWNGRTFKEPVIAGFPERKREGYYEGTFEGKPVHFKKLFRKQVTLTDEQCESLCAGEVIEIRGLKSKAGKEYGITAKLNPDMSFTDDNGREVHFCGVDQVAFLDD